MSKLPSIPSIPGNVDPQLYQVLSALKVNIDNLPANTVTQTELVSALSNVPPGQAGPPGPNGDSYVLDITGGNTSIIYNEYGLSPLPHLAPFGYLFYKNSVSITTDLVFSWSITHPGNSLLSGISTSDTFIPAIAPTFDATKADNSVFLVVTHLGMQFTAVEPISISAIGATGNDVANFSINNAAATFNKNANNTISPSAGINLTTTVQNITSPTYQWQLNSVAISGATADSYTVPTSAYASVTSNTYKCIVTGIINGIAGSTLADTITIPLLVDGLSVPTVVLSNESLSFTALNTGYTGIAFAGGGCNVTAYIGSTGLAYGTTGASTFSCTNSSTGATVAAGTGSGSIYAVAAPTAMSAETAYTDVIVTMRDASGAAIPAITKRISYSLSRAGKSHLLFIMGGITNAIYDEYGSNPLPAQTPFSCELYENGALVTPATYAWSVPSTGSLLTGSSTTSTFTPTVAATFDSAKANNKVLLTATYAGITLKASQTIVMTQNSPVDATPPPAIGGLTVTSGVLYNFLDWGVVPGNSDHVEIWRSATNNRDGAVPATKVGTSLFTIYADYIPAGVGTRYYYWIRARSIAGVDGAWNASATNGAYATPGGITDLQVSTISANKIFALTLSALTANLGNVTAGTLKSPDARFNIDLVNKFIIVGNATNNPGSVNPWYGSEYVDVRSGSLTTYQWNGSAYVSSKSLRVIETGVATNGVTVSLTKYYSSQPKISVSPANLQVYSGNNPTQNQTLLLSASGITGSGSAWSFIPTATLQLAAALSGTTVVGATQTSTTDVAVVSAQRATADNSTSIICSVTINSQRGTGAAPNWYNRQVSLRIGCRTSPTAGAYTYGATTVVAMGSDKDANTVTISRTGLTADIWYFVVEYTSANVAGNPTWSDGGAAYEYDTDTVNLTANSALYDTGYVTSATEVNIVCNPTMPAFTPAAGYSVYGVVYTISYGYRVVSVRSSSIAQVLNNLGTTLHSITYPYAGEGSSVDGGALNVPSATNTVTITSASYTPTVTLLNATASGYPFNDAYARSQVRIFASGTSAVISSRKANINTTAIANAFTLNNYYSNISGTAPLASGTLNWMAIL